MTDFNRHPNRAIAVLIVAIAGGATWAAIILSEGSFRQANELPVMLRITTLSAGLGGLATVGLFGRQGGWGLGCFLVGAVLATAIGSAFAATWVGGPIGLAMGPTFVFSAIATNPPVTCVWVSLMTLAHAAASQSVSPENSGCP